MLLQFFDSLDVEAELVDDVERTARVAGGSECNLTTNNTDQETGHDSTVAESCSCSRE
jgi:hypothetical protein